MPQSVDTLVYIGAGQAVAFEPWPEAKHTLLVDANAQTCEQLKQRFANNSNITVAQHTVAAQTGEATWVALNMPEYSALSQPSGLFELFPGLKVVAEKPVQTMGIVELLASTLTRQQHTIGLVINVPDIAAELVNAVLTSEWQNKLAFISVTTQSNAMYGSAANHEVVLQQLQQYQYLLQWQNTEDRDFPQVSFVINPLVAELQQAQAQIAPLEAKVKELTAALEQTKNERDAECIAKEQYAAEAKQAKEQKEKFEQHYVQHQQKMAELQQENNQLKEDNKQTQQRQTLLEAELLKAEAQMNIITELLLKGSEDSQ